MDGDGGATKTPMDWYQEILAFMPWCPPRVGWYVAYRSWRSARKAKPLFPDNVTLLVRMPGGNR